MGVVGRRLIIALTTIVLWSVFMGIVVLLDW